MYGGVNTVASSSSAASAVADDTHLIYDDCPGSRALMAAAAKQQQRQQLYSFHSLPHPRQTSPAPNATLAQQAARANSSVHPNTQSLPYGYQSAHSTPRRATTSLSQNYLSDQQTSFAIAGDGSSQDLCNTAPLQRKQTGQPSQQYSQNSITPSQHQSIIQLQEHMDGQHIETRGILKDSQEMAQLQRRGSSASGKRYVDVYGTSMESQGGSRTTLTGVGSIGMLGGSLSSRTESNTVVEKMDYQTSIKGPQGGGSGPTENWRSSNQNGNSRSQTSLLSAGGGSFIMAQNKDSDDEDVEEQLDDANEENISSEDNLSHDSYELIEKEGELLQNNNDMSDLIEEELDNDNKAMAENKNDINVVSSFRNSDHLNDGSNLIMNNRKGSNQFEEEFYRQANSSIVSNMGDTPPLTTGPGGKMPLSPITKQHILDAPQMKQNLNQDEETLLKQEQTISSSSKMSSRCSLNSSIILSPPPNVAQHLTHFKPPPAQVPVSPNRSSHHSKPPNSQDESKNKSEETTKVTDSIKALNKEGLPTRMLTRVNSQDSFSQASAHPGITTTTPGATPIPPPSSIQGIMAESPLASDPSGTVIYDDFAGHEVNLHRHPQTPEERLMVDIVRNRGGLQLNNPQQINHVMQERLRQQQHQIMQQQAQQLPPNYYSMHHKYICLPRNQQFQYEDQQHHVQPRQHIQPQTHHSLPRQMYHQNYQLVRQPSDPMHENLVFQHPIRAKYFTPKVYHPQSQVQVQQYVHHPSQIPFHQPTVAQNQYISRTLPNQKRGIVVNVSDNSGGRGNSPVFFNPRNRQPGECSSGSSSSHASPRMSRPKSLEFGLSSNSGNGIQNTSNRKEATIDKQNRLQQIHHDYDDSSSAISAIMANEPHYYATSSSDVPQTPENPSTTILDTVKKNKQYYSKPEERIYDVPEGIEGVTDKIRIPPASFSKESVKDSSQLKATSGKEIIDLTSPSSSSGINEPFPKPVGGKPAIGAKPSLPPPTTAPPPPPSANGAAVESTRPSTHSGHFQQGHRSRYPVQRVEVDQRKFHSLLNAIDQRDSIESCESTSIPKPSKNIIGIRSKIGILPLPTHRPMLLPSMSSTSTEDDPSLSARSAPTPVRDVEEIIDITKDEEEGVDDELEDEEEDHYEKNSGTIKEGKKKRLEMHKQVPQVSVNLISPPGESESSAAVLTSEGNVPAPPPEFSSSGPITNPDPREDTDVEDGADEDDLAVQGFSKQADVTATSSSNGKRYSIDRYTHSAEEESTDDLHDGTTSASQPSKDTVVSNIQDHTQNEYLRRSETLETSDQFHSSIYESHYGETDTIKRGKDNVTPPQSPISRQAHMLERGDSNHKEENIKIAQMYVKACGRNGKDEYASSGSDDGPSDTTSGTERNEETDPDNLPFIDAERPKRESELIEDLDGLSCGGSSSRKNSRENFFHASPDQSHNQNTGMYSLTSDNSKHDISARIATAENGADVEPHENDAFMQRLPSLPTGDSASSLNIEDVSPIPPPLQLQDSILEYDDDVVTSSEVFENKEGGENKEFAAVDIATRSRILSRISERSSSEETPQRVIVNVEHINKDTSVVIHANDINGSNGAIKEPILKETSPARSNLSRSGSEASNERAEDTMSEQNCTTSEDIEANPPSLCSDLPENTIMKVSPQKHPIAKPEISEESPSSKDSKDFPSPPSSMLEATTTTATQECRTEVTQIESDCLFLEVTPTELGDEKCSSSNGEAFKSAPEPTTTENLDRKSDNVKLGVDKIPYDISISSECEVTHNQETQDQNSEGSLHDSMEILEEIATEDHFERELDSEEDYDDDDGERDIFEMPPMPTSVVPRIHPEMEQQAQQHCPQMQNLEQDIPETRGEENVIQPYTLDPQQIQQIRLHQHSPTCRLPKPNGNGDEFIF